MNKIRYWLVFKLRHLLDWIHPDVDHCWVSACICNCQEADNLDGDGFPVDWDDLPEHEKW